MRNPLAISLILALLVGCWIANGQTLIGRPVKPLNSSTACLTENFEAAGYDVAGWTETQTGSSDIDPDYTGTVLQGSQSLRFVKAAASTAYTTNFLGCVQQEVWVYFLLRPVDIEAGVTRTIASLRTNTTDWVNLQITSTGALRAQSGVTITTVGTMSEGTTYHVWIHYKADSGPNNGVIDIGFSTDGIKPTSGNNFAQSTVNTIEDYMNRLYLGLEGTTAGVFEYIFDKVRVASAEIGSNPP